jgi:hypothetical protein
MSKRGKAKGGACAKRKKRHDRGKSKRLLKKVMKAPIQKTLSTKKYLHIKVYGNFKCL